MRTPAASAATRPPTAAGPRPAWRPRSHRSTGRVVQPVRIGVHLCTATDARLHTPAVEPRYRGVYATYRGRVAGAVEVSADTHQAAAGQDGDP